MRKEKKSARGRKLRSFLFMHPYRQRRIFLDNIVYAKGNDPPPLPASSPCLPPSFGLFSLTTLAALSSAPLSFPTFPTSSPSRLLTPTAGLGGALARARLALSAARKGRRRLARRACRRRLPTREVPLLCACRGIRLMLVMLLELVEAVVGRGLGGAGALRRSFLRAGRRPCTEWLSFCEVC